MSNLRTYEYTLPSGNVITFREPYTKDRQKIVNMLKPEDRYTVEELLAAYCIIAINKGAVGDPDPRHRMSGWKIRDQQIFTRIFLTMFTMNEDEAKGAEETAKKLLSGEGSSSDTSSESIGVSS